LQNKTWMPGIADKFTQSAQSRLLWPGMTRRKTRRPGVIPAFLFRAALTQFTDVIIRESG